MKIYNIKDRQEYIKEFAELTKKEWGKNSLKKEDFDKEIQVKIKKIKEQLNNTNYCTLILLEENKLVGFISIFPHDSKEREDLTPWYATMFVKKEYRGNGYSKILNRAILEEARKRKFKKLYLKTDLKNYYEKFGAKFIKNLKNGEKLYCFEL